MNTATVTTPPARLVGPRPDGPDGRRFPWGPIDRVHEIGDIQIVEFRRDLSTYRATGGSPDPYARHGATEFHSYINRQDTGRTFDTLDSAIVGAIAYKREGVNSRAATYFDRMTLPARDLR